MNKFPLIISFYTKNTPYEYEIEKLKASCEQFSLEADIEGIESAGSWEMNCGYKPLFILKKLQEHKRSVLWVDADGVILRPPFYLEVFNSDVAVRVNHECGVTHPSKMVSATLYANYTPQSFHLIKLWAQLSLEELNNKERSQEFWDQISLREAISSSSHEALVGMLPVSYTKIFDHPLDNQVCSDPIIEHYQASRLYKGWITPSFS